jgi:CRISPR system Cascade subunit CasE
MTILSRLELQSRHLGVARDLADVAEMHRTIMRAFPRSGDASPRAALGVLFRAELDAQRTIVLVQSKVRPEWDQLADGYLVRAETKHIGDSLAGIADGRELRFLLVANPSRKIARDGARNSQRVEMRTDDERHRWLADRAARHGFRLGGHGPHDGVRVDRIVMPRPTRGTSHSRITVKPVRYEGRLVVTDAELFVDTIQRGLGPAKAYGCGLLSVAPA